MLAGKPSLKSETIIRMGTDPLRAVTSGRRATPLGRGDVGGILSRLRASFLVGGPHEELASRTTAHRSWRPSERILRPARHGAFIALAVYLVLLGAGQVPLAVDAHAYWNADPLNPYWQSRLGDFNAYFYAPAFAQVLWPLTRLPWSVFAAVWTGILVIAMYLQAGRWFGLVVPLVAVELAMGNIHILIGLAVAAGLAWPAAWAFALLTKITPGSAFCGSWRDARPGHWRSRPLRPRHSSCRHSY